MFDRIIKLIGSEKFELISKKKILLVGIGGVGGIALEALVRSGFKDITIIDHDKFVDSNLNRQIIATESDLDKYKVDIAKKRCKAINSEVNIKTSMEYITSQNVANLGYFDYIIDACDTVDAKVALIKYAKDNNIKIISCMGTGKRLNPTMVQITTLDKTYNDPLAKVMRNKLRDYKFKKIPVVFSQELPLNNDKVIASMMMVPATAGLCLVYFVINDIIKE